MPCYLLWNRLQRGLSYYKGDHTIITIPAKRRSRWLKKDIARQRIEILFRNVLDTAKYDLELAERQAMLMKRISMRYRIRLPYEIRQLFCKRCKRLIIPGVTSRVRIGRSSIRAVRITCLHCNHVYRKMIARDDWSARPDRNNIQQI